MYDNLINKPVLVRSNRGGMYLGTLLVAYEDKTLHIRARRLWSWTGALDSSVLARSGPTGGRIGPECEFLLLPEAQVVELVAASSSALEALEKISVWKE